MKFFSFFLFVEPLLPLAKAQRTTKKIINVMIEKNDSCKGRRGERVFAEGSRKQEEERTG